jgi:hypothetical protein
MEPCADTAWRLFQAIWKTPWRGQRIRLGDHGKPAPNALCGCRASPAAGGGLRL